MSGADLHLQVQAAPSFAVVYVRKVDRSGHWNPDASKLEGIEPAQFVADAVFPDDGGTVSVYKVSSPLDLHKVSIGLNSNRSSLTEQLFLLEVPEQLIDELGLSINGVPGETGCECANRLHFDLTYDRDTILQLVSRLRGQGVQIRRMNKTEMKSAAETLGSKGCTAITEQSGTCGN